MKSIILAVLLLTGLQLIGQTGKIAGNVVSIQDSIALPLSEVSISIAELEKTIVANENGRFKFNDIPVGNYTLVYTHPKLGRGTLKEVLVEVNSVAIVRLELPSQNARKEN